MIEVNKRLIHGKGDLSKVLKNQKLILKNQGGHSDSFRINGKSFRAIRGLQYNRQLSLGSIVYTPVLYTVVL